MSNPATPAITVTRESTFDASPDRMWEVVGPFCAIADWHPAIASCSETTAGGVRQRTLTLAGGGTIIEDELSRSDVDRSYTYRIVDSPLPVVDYTATIRVESGAVVWYGSFNAKPGSTEAEARDTIAGIYEAGLAGIADALK